MELRHLRYFVTVAEELNFRRAGERLNVTRPALSKQVKDLEDELGVLLLERNTVRVKLTEAGAAYLNEARVILAQVERAGQHARDVQAGRSGRLVIASVGPIAAGFLPQTLRSFRDEFPDVDVSFVEMTPPEQLEAIAKGTIHVGFAYGKEVSLPKGFKHLRVLAAKYGVALSSHHPLADRISVRLKDVETDALLCFGTPSESTHCRDVRELFAAENCGFGPARYIQGFDALLTMVAADQGIALLPMLLDQMHLAGIAMKPILAEKANLDFNMWAVWKDEGAPLVPEFMRRLKERLPGADSASDGKAA